MTTFHQLTASIERGNDGFVSLCPELDIASQGDTVEEAHANLREAVELFLECASEREVNERLQTDARSNPKRNQMIIEQPRYRRTTA